MSELGNAAAVDDTFEEIYKIDCDSPDLQIIHGNCLLEMKNYKEAETIFSNVLSNGPDGLVVDDPETKLAIYGLARLYKETSQLDMAAGAYQKYLLLEPEDVVGLFNYASVSILLGETDEAFYALARAYKIDPSNTDVAFNLAGLMEKKEGVKTAYNFLLEVYKIHPTDTPIIYSLARLSREIGNEQLLIELCEILRIYDKNRYDVLTNELGLGD
jgi:tetratricopeptide (TPR) repeat protein